MSYYPYLPRELVSDLGVWIEADHAFKVYAILAEGQSITDAVLQVAKQFLSNDIPSLLSLHDESDELGFIIIHPGEHGVSVLVHWWVQGSVLCQQVRRWDSSLGFSNDMSSKQVVACVWELELIYAEQKIWQKAMMTDKANPERYLETRPQSKTV